MAQSEIPFEHRVVHDPDPAGVGLSAVGDFNGDGCVDALVGTKAGKVFWYENPSMAVHSVFSGTRRVFASRSSIHDIVQGL